MTTLTKQLEKWFEGRPKWMQDATRRLVVNGFLTKQDFGELVSICVDEANEQPVVFNGVPADGLNLQDVTKPLRLTSISDVQGINALSPTKPLVFGNTPLCIVYGRNGAGKSGYVRLLKHGCGARNPGGLLHDIFKNNPLPQAAKFSFDEDAQNHTSLWAGKPLPELRGINVYDTASGLVYVNDENEVAFEPWLLRLFTQLTAACEELSRLIQTKIQANVSAKPLMPHEYSATSSASWYLNLTDKTTVQELNKLTNWVSDDESDLNELAKRLAETNPSAKAATVRHQASVLLDFIAFLKRLYGAFSNENSTNFIRTKNEAANKRKAADQDAQIVFAKAPLAGVGSESWRLLWEAARTYSLGYAYNNLRFPNVGDGSRCVLCQQKLDQESRERFQSFEHLLNERIKAARAAATKGDAEYEKEAKALCRDIRILLEQIVEIDLLSGVVRRYNPEVQTKGKIQHLSKITDEDCKFIDDMMTEYSRYEHSQPDEAPIDLPQPDEIENHLKEIVGFIEGVQKRNKAV